MAALEPYKTPDGGYGYALEPDGRGPTSQPPHIWTALEALEDAGTTDPRVCDHLDDDHRARRRASRSRCRRSSRTPRAPWWGDRDRGHAARHRAARTRRWRATASRTRGSSGAEAFCWGAVDAIEKTHPYEVEAAITFLDAAPRPRAGGAAAERLGAAGARAGAGRHAARGLLAGRDPPSARLRQAAGQPRAAPGSPTRRSRRPRSTLAAQQREDGGWPITWAVWTPAIEIEWSGLVTIAALKTLQAYGRL